MDEPAGHPTPGPAGPAHPGVRFPPPLLWVGGLVASWALERRWPLPLPLPAALRVVGGTALLAGGLALAAWALLTFARAGTAVYPHAPATVLVVHGPYRWTRNPMYLALTTAYLGLTLRLGSGWPLLLLPLVLAGLWRWVVRREERYLAHRFGAAYADYRQRAPRWLGRSGG